MLEQIKTHLLGTGDMAPWLRVISALAGDPGSAPSTQKVAYIHLHPSISLGDAFF